MKKIMLLAIIGTFLFCKNAMAGDWEDIWAPYLERHDKATATSGNAQAINRNTHIITPWPYYVRNRRIPGNGARMVNKYELYQSGKSSDSSSDSSATDTGSSDESSSSSETSK
jgi:hypothetical protein